MHTPIRTVLEQKGSEVRTTTPDALVIDAVHAMNTHAIGALVVCDGRAPVGMFTERDVMRRVIADRLDPHSTPVRRVMTTQVAVVSPDVTIFEAMSIITEKRFRHLPVVEEGRIVGLVSAGDLTKWVARDQARDIQDLIEYIHGPHAKDSEPPQPTVRRV